MTKSEFMSRYLMTTTTIDYTKMKLINMKD